MKGGRSKEPEKEQLKLKRQLNLAIELIKQKLSTNAVTRDV